MKSTTKYFMGDFETTVYKGQAHTEVWASALVELYTDDVKIFHSIDDTFDYLCSLNSNIVCYYHNLKFDGAFWVSYLLEVLNFKQAYNLSETPTGITQLTYEWQSNREMHNKTFKYLISSMGQWYSIVFKYNNKIIELRDSFKLLPFSVKRIGQSFGTKHKKLDIEYTGFRYAGCEITEKEREYIANDVLVVKEALEIMFDEGHEGLTIGACCLKEFKNTLENANTYKTLFPNLYDREIDKNIYGSETVGEYVHHSYRGGWCYLVRGKENAIFDKGFTADVNSLYPSVMSSESLSLYPVGEGTMWSGNYIPDIVYKESKYFFVRVKTEFYLKKGKLPFIQIKNTMTYKSTEMLETSDIRLKDGTYTNRIIDLDGKERPTYVIMTFTCTDYKLFLEHYNVVNFEILDGVYFDSDIGIFDDYINKYKKIKLTAKGAKRELSKLFLNNLYGKMASSKTSSFKVAELNEEHVVEFFEQPEFKKTPGYIPVGSAITSYARNFTIRAAQQNYYGADKPGFIYADTDSIHCNLPVDEVKGIKIHQNNFCCWKIESEWDEGLFVRQKTYLEHVVKEDGEIIENPYYNIKCAGMPEKCKQLFLASITQDYSAFKKKIEDTDLGDEVQYNLTDEEIDFIKEKRKITDFKVGLCIPGKLLPKRIRGGIVLEDTTYQLR